MPSGAPSKFAFPSSSVFNSMPPRLCLPFGFTGCMITAALRTGFPLSSFTTTKYSHAVGSSSMPVPIPMIKPLRPTAASSGGYLFIASSDTLVQEVLAVKAGDKPGLKSTAEFKRLAQGIPDKGNQFSYMSAKFGRAVMEIQQQVIAGQAAQNSSPGQMDWLKSFLNPNRATFSYSVGQNTSDGCLTVGN